MAPCPDHPGAAVTSERIRKTADGPVQVLRCGAGEGHYFSVRVADDVGPSPRQPPPPCPEHPGSHVVRNGTYGTSTAKRRQQYRCYPNPGDRARWHKFTPVLPRFCVHDGEDHCEHCDELRGLHRGERAAARRHTWTSRDVAEGLAKLAAGASYAEVGRWARRVRGVERTRRPSGTATNGDPADEAADEGTTTDDTGADGRKRRRSAAGDSARNAWHIAADWTEAFAPVVYEPIDRRLRRAALADRQRLDDLIADDKPLVRPQVWLLDDVPVYGRDLDSGVSRRDAGFFVLVIAEVVWDAPGPVSKLRLVRAMAKSNQAAWRLCFDELGYAPDFIVADAGTGLNLAVQKHFAGGHTRFVPSMWHLKNRVDTALGDIKGAHILTPRGKELIDPLRDHLALLRRGTGVLDGEATWATWWDGLEALLAANGLPGEKVRTSRRNNEPLMAAVLDVLADHPDVPVSTGGLETLISKNVEPLLALRRTAFANIERTNLLFDLVVARHHHAFDRIADVARAIQADTAAADGYTVALRSVADPRGRDSSYSSLRDVTLLEELARKKGLT